MVHAEHEKRLAVRRARAVLAFARASRELVGAERVLRTEIARTDAVSAAEKSRRLRGRERRKRAAEFRRLVGLAQRHANVARERIVARKSFVRAFEDDDVLLAA